MKDIDVVEYTLPAHLKPAIIYGDMAGKDSEDISKLEAFNATVHEANGSDLWISKDFNQTPYFSQSNDYSNEAGDVLDFLIVRII